MQDIEMRTLSDEEAELLVAMARAEERSAAYRKKRIVDIIMIIGSSLFCFGGLAIVAAIVWVLIKLPGVSPEIAEASSNISNIGIVNKIVEYGLRMEDDAGILLILGLGAALFDIICAKPMNYIFQKLPIGKSFLSLSEKIPEAKIINKILPALIVGIYLTVYYIGVNLFPKIIPFCQKTLLYITIGIVGITLLALLVDTLVHGSVYGLLLRGSLLIAGNFGLSLLFGYVGAMASTLFVLVAGLAIGIIVVLFIFKWAAISSLFD